MPKISVIVPVYNVEKYLRRCVDSILSQTFSDFELILVDDGSPDGRPGICDDYKESDDRVRVIHKKNGGVSSARNAGLEEARGEWIAFIDSDDWVCRKYLDILFKACVENNVLFSSCEMLVADNYFELDIDKTAAEIVDSTYHLTKRFEACGKLFAREIIGEKKFNQNLIIGEDAVFVSEMISETKRLRW